MWSLYPNIDGGDTFGAVSIGSLIYHSLAAVLRSNNVFTANSVWMQ